MPLDSFGDSLDRFVAFGLAGNDVLAAIDSVIAVEFDGVNGADPLLGGRADVEIDGASRVLVPPELRSWAGLERDVKFMGVGSNFELWDTARYEAREAEMIAGGRPEVLRNMVIR